MNQSCQIVRDLMPLHIEHLTTEQSRHFVDQHIAECAECAELYKKMGQDFMHRTKDRSNQQSLQPLLSKLVKYQQKIKLFGVLTAMFLSCIITGASVQFLATIPLLLITPFICRLFYDKSMPIIASSIPFALIGGMLSGEGLSYIPFFAAITLLFTCVGVGTGVLIKLGAKQLSTGRKWAFIVPAIALLLLSSIAFFSLFGNPIGYVTTMIKTKQYVQQTYEAGTLTFKGVSFNFKDKRHSGQFEYILDGIRQTAAIELHPHDIIYDQYKYVLETTFSEERAADLRADFAAAIDFIPTTILSITESELSITHDELNHRYQHLSYDLERRNKAAAMRRSESEKLSFEISFGEFHDEPLHMSKDLFIEKSIALLHAVHDQDSAFKRIKVTSLDTTGRQQSVYFERGALEQDVIESYAAEVMEGKEISPAQS